MPDYDWVRVKAKDSGHKFSMIRSAAEADPDAFQILKQDAVDHNDQPLPPEFPDSPAPTSGQKATDSNKES